MTNNQQLFDFDGESGKETPRKTLYDKILEEQAQQNNEAASSEPQVEDKGTDNDQRMASEEAGGEWMNAASGNGQEATSEESNEGMSERKSGGDGDNGGDGGNGSNGGNGNDGNDGNDGGRRRRQKRLNVFFIVLFSVLFLVLGYLIYTLITERADTEEMKLTLEMQKESLTTELNELYASYDTLQTANDSMNILIQDRQKEIRSLLAIRESNAKKIRIYDKQVKSLRQVLKSYIFQVDSLNQANLRLQAENKAQQDQIRNATSTNRKLEKVNKNLQNQVDKAAILTALAIRAEPIETNGAIARRIKRTDKIRVCFSLAANAVARRGLKRIYVRIANPDERVMVKNMSEVFDFQGDAIPYSAMREVDYEGDELEVCIYYDADKSEILSGTYYVDLYMDGEQIGTTSFSLR